MEEGSRWGLNPCLCKGPTFSCSAILICRGPRGVLGMCHLGTDSQKHPLSNCSVTNARDVQEMLVSKGHTVGRCFLCLPRLHPAQDTCHLPGSSAAATAVPEPAVDPEGRPRKLLHRSHKSQMPRWPPTSSILCVGAGAGTPSLRMALHTWSHFLLSPLPPPRPYLCERQSNREGGKLFIHLLVHPRDAHSNRGRATPKPGT